MASINVLPTEANETTDRDHLTECEADSCVCDPLHEFISAEGNILALQQHDTFIIADHALKEAVRELIQAWS